MPPRIPIRLLSPHNVHTQCWGISRSFSLRTLATKASTDSPSIDPITLHRLEVQRRAYYKRRSYYAAAGFIFGMVGIWLTATSIELPPNGSGAAKMDSGRKDNTIAVIGKERKVVVQKLGEEPEEIPDVVQTGTSTVPTFPRVLEFEDIGEEVEYQLVGLGIRTVSFLGIQVYVVGLYIATDDIAALQASLVTKIAPGASTLVAGEKEDLRKLLFDPEESEQVWGDVLKDKRLRTLIRIVPTRNTDFHHLRDAWVRQITARSQTPANKVEYGEESFGIALAQFKQLLNRGSVPKGKELILSRDRKGSLAISYDDGKAGPQRLGTVHDERISRAVWLNYLAGKGVASEAARKSIVDGVMEFVERPVGTVATQVHEIQL